MFESKIIYYNEMPLFQKATITNSYEMQGSLENFACFFYLTTGKLNSYDARGRHELRPKEGVVKNCGNYVQHFICEYDNQQCEAIAIYLYPDLIKAIYKDDLPTFVTNPNGSMPQKYLNNKLLDQYVTNLLLYFEEVEHVDTDLATLKLKELVLLLLKSELHDGIKSLFTEIFSPVEVEFRAAIENNLFNTLSIDQLAFICGMSLSSFKRKFKEVYDTTPARYIKNQRLTQAAKQLKNTDQYVSEIAYNVGFVDVTTFSDSFHKQFGKSPSKYRAEPT